MLSNALPPRHESDAELASALARLWPNREHESNAVASLLCRVGVNYWRQLDLTEFASHQNIRCCFWCSNIKIDGTIHKP